MGGPNQPLDKDQHGIIAYIDAEVSRNKLIFKNKSYLDTMQPPAGATISGRERQKQQLVQLLISYHNGLVAPLISVYGKSGTGKTATVVDTCMQLEEIGTLSFTVVNLRRARTVFGCANAILSALGGACLKSAGGVTHVMELIEGAIEQIITDPPQSTIGNFASSEGRNKKKQLFVLVLDEIDVVFRDRRTYPSDFFYELLLIEEGLKAKGHLMTIIAISNEVMSGNNELDDRVKSRIGSCEVYFAAYSREELTKILEDRTSKAFAQPIDLSLIDKCAKLSAREHGDARRAIDLLKRAGEIACLHGEQDIRKGITISMNDVDRAHAELQEDSITTVVKDLPFHQRVTLAALVRLDYLIGKNWYSTSELRQQYLWILRNTRPKESQDEGQPSAPLSDSRFAEILRGLKDLGILRSHTGSDGRYGYHARYMLTENAELIGRALFSGPVWKQILDLKERRELYLREKSFQKTKNADLRLFKTIVLGKDEVPEMNDHLWNIRVHGEFRAFI